MMLLFRWLYILPIVVPALVRRYADFSRMRRGDAAKTRETRVIVLRARRKGERRSEAMARGA